MSCWPATKIPSHWSSTTIRRGSGKILSLDSPISLYRNSFMSTASITTTANARKVSSLSQLIKCHCNPNFPPLPYKLPPLRLWNRQAKSTFVFTLQECSQLSQWSLSQWTFSGRLNQMTTKAAANPWLTWLSWATIKEGSQAVVHRTTLPLANYAPKCYP